MVLPWYFHYACMGSYSRGTSDFPVVLPYETFGLPWDSVIVNPMGLQSASLVLPRDMLEL